jgi:hypothetical protein
MRAQPIGVQLHVGEPPRRTLSDVPDRPYQPPPPTAAEIRYGLAVQYLRQPEVTVRLVDLLRPRLAASLCYARGDEVLVTGAPWLDNGVDGLRLTIPFLLRARADRARETAVRGQIAEAQKEFVWNSAAARETMTAREGQEYLARAAQAFDEQARKWLATAPRWRHSGGQRWDDQALGIHVIVGDTARCNIWLALSREELQRHLLDLAEMARPLDPVLIVSEDPLTEAARGLLDRQGVLHVRLGDAWQAFERAGRPEQRLVASEEV